MKRPEDYDRDYPPLLKLLLFVGRPMGLTFVPQHNVQVINRMGRYAGVKGPGLMYYNRFTETLGPLVFIGGQIREYELDNIISRDVLPVTMSVSATVAYDPAMGQELASVLTRIPREAYVGIAGTYVRWGLLAAANEFTATELTRHDVRAQIENAVRDRANAELAFLGLKIMGKLRITRVQLPVTLSERHETIAQRRANILSGGDFHPVEYRRALVSEVIEHLARSGGAESFLNFGEMLDSYAAEKSPPTSQPRLTDAPNVIEQPARLEDGRAPLDAPPPKPADQADTPPPPNRRNRSRL